MRLSSPSFLRLPFLRLAGAAGVVALLAACGGDQPAAPTAPRITLSVGDPGIASRISEVESWAYWMPFSSVPHSPSVRPSKPMMAEWPK